MKFTFDWHVPGLHVYQTVWSPNIGEGDLECKHENKNEEDDFVTGIYNYDFQRETLIGHTYRC